MTKCNWTTPERFAGEWKLPDFFAKHNLYIQESKDESFSWLLVKKLAMWAYDIIMPMPIRLTLENVTVFTLILIVIMPNAITYLLIYPIFRLVFGTLYPAYASYKAVRTKNVKEYVKWMMYWIVFALFTSAEIFTDMFLSFWLPFYYEIKIILVIWLLSPATKGSSILYRRFVHPALSRREAEIDEALARATEQGYAAVVQLGTKSVNYATTVLMQTAIKGGGGLVQQLRKSYSLSDLAGGKEDENQNTEQSPDEVDLDEPRRRDRGGRRGYSPRRTQSSNNRMDMYFSEVDLEMRKSSFRDPVGSLANIKSSDDISSGYSSGEALQSQRNLINNEHLVRTASIGGRNRTKPRSVPKKATEVNEVQEDEHAKNIEQLSSVNPLSYLSIDQRYKILSFFSKSVDNTNMLKLCQNVNDSADNSSTRKSDPPCAKSMNKEPKDTANSVIDIKVEEEKLKQSSEKSIAIDSKQINNDVCSDRLDELNELLQNANKVVATIVSSQENLYQLNNTLTNIRCPMNRKTITFLDANESRSVSRSNSDCSERAGKYNKKPAPKIPIVTKDEEEEEKALKATLVIKAERFKSSSGNDTVGGAVIKRRKKANNAKVGAKESFSKLLTIPKNMFHSAFHKDKDEDLKSVTSEPSISRSGSHESVKCELDVTTVILEAINEERTKSREGDTYVNLKSDSIDCDVPASRIPNTEKDIKDHCSEMIHNDETIV
ncbi:PREDICTED: uncharacterized protein LOC105368371 [Ceratosolen solmsi marchali]|uniref:Uncharacterized protein LOC105368371 n=1 Tax=Ceratosolen solmsi marchali TaxID=326594 RepID=A0AAJ6YWE7_9HYME|nr:PREDICTED: uncharacterized protein LOC105368371 [Ceratosolen solmsi marchali]